MVEITIKGIEQIDRNITKSMTVEIKSYDKPDIVVRKILGRRAIPWIVHREF